MATRPTRSSARTGSAAPARKAVSALVVKEGEGAWTKAEIKEVLSELHSDRDRVVSTLSGQEAELDKLMRDAGDGAGHDQADMGVTGAVTAVAHQLVQLGLLAGQRADHAVRRCSSDRTSLISALVQAPRPP